MLCVIIYRYLCGLYSFAYYSKAAFNNIVLTCLIFHAGAEIGLCFKYFSILNEIEADRDSENFSHLIFALGYYNS